MKIKSDKEWQSSFAGTPYGVINSVDKAYDLIQYSSVCGTSLTLVGISAKQKNGRTSLVAHVESQIADEVKKSCIEISTVQFKQICQENDQHLTNMCEA